MEVVFFNGSYIPKEKVSVSPDDRGFLFADGIYEVVRWYGKAFFDMESHMTRLERSLRETGILWKEMSLFPGIATELVRVNNLASQPAMVYLQVTRGSARRSHSFPDPPVQPTVYAFAFGFVPDKASALKGIKVMLKEDIRWSRCDIKSIALLPNTLSFQEAYSEGMKECIFVRAGYFTEGSHSNVFFVVNGELRTHPESGYILSGITRKNVLRIAENAGIIINELPVNQRDIEKTEEAFITNTSSEVMPVIEMGGIKIGTGKPGRITTLISEKFRKETNVLK